MEYEEKKDMRDVNAEGARWRVKIKTRELEKQF